MLVDTMAAILQHCHRIWSWPVPFYSSLISLHHSRLQFCSRFHEGLAKLTANDCEQLLHEDDDSPLHQVLPVHAISKPRGGMRTTLFSSRHSSTLVPFKTKLNFKTEMRRPDGHSICPVFPKREDCGMSTEQGSPSPLYNFHGYRGTLPFHVAGEPTSRTKHGALLSACGSPPGRGRSSEAEDLF